MRPLGSASKAAIGPAGLRGSGGVTVGATAGAAEAVQPVPQRAHFTTRGPAASMASGTS
jgi:hypothetical protein